MNIKTLPIANTEPARSLKKRPRSTRFTETACPAASPGGAHFRSDAPRDSERNLSSFVVSPASSFRALVALAGYTRALTCALTFSLILFHVELFKITS